MTCEICGKKTSLNWGDSTAILCKNCYNTEDGKSLLSEPQRAREKEISSQRRGAAEDIEQSTYTSTYQTARTIAKVVSFVGWIVAVVSAIAFIGTLLLSGQILGEALLFPLLLRLGGIVIGIFIIGTGQLMRVGVDTADHTGEILALIKAERLSRNEKNSVVEGSSP